MIARFRLVIAATALVCLSGAAIAADYPSAENGLLGVVDVPSYGKPRSVSTPRRLESGAPWTITCYDYPGYRVKQLVGGGKGDLVASMEITPAGARLPVCGTQDDPGEKLVAPGLFMTGARGGFVIFTINDAPTHFFYDAASGKQVYKDEIEGGKVLSFQVTGDVATMSYVRHVSGPCPLLTGGASCWQRFVKEAKLSAEIARMGPPSASCEAASRGPDGPSGLKREDFRVLTYVATVTFYRNGHSTTVSRSNIGCSFDP